MYCIYRIRCKNIRDFIRLTLSYLMQISRKVKELSYYNSQQLRVGYLAWMSNPVPYSECIWYFSREVIKDSREIYLVTLQSHQGHWDLVQRSKQHLKHTMQHLLIK